MGTTFNFAICGLLLACLPACLAKPTTTAHSDSDAAAPSPATLTPLATPEPTTLSVQVKVDEAAQQPQQWQLPRQQWQQTAPRFPAVFNGGFRVFSDSGLPEVAPMSGYDVPFYPQQQQQQQQVPESDFATFQMKPEMTRESVPVAEQETNQERTTEEEDAKQSDVVAANEQQQQEETRSFVETPLSESTDADDVPSFAAEEPIDRIVAQEPQEQEASADFAGAGSPQEQEQEQPEEEHYEPTMPDEDQRHDDREIVVVPADDVMDEQQQQQQEQQEPQEQYMPPMSEQQPFLPEEPLHHNMVEDEYVQMEPWRPVATGIPYDMRPMIDQPFQPAPYVRGW